MTFLIYRLEDTNRNLSASSPTFYLCTRLKFDLRGHSPSLPPRRKQRSRASGPRIPAQPLGHEAHAGGGQHAPDGEDGHRQRPEGGERPGGDGLAVPVHPRGIVLLLDDLHRRKHETGPATCSNNTGGSSEFVAPEICSLASVT